MITSRDALFFLITNQKKFRDGFKFVNLKTHETATVEDCYDTIMRDLEVLEQLEILKNYYPPFKKFLEEMFKNGYNEDLIKIKEWLENE